MYQSARSSAEADAETKGNVFCSETEVLLLPHPKEVGWEARRESIDSSPSSLLVAPCRAVLAGIAEEVAVVVVVEGSGRLTSPSLAFPRAPTSVTGLLSRLNSTNGATAAHAFLDCKQSSKLDDDDDDDDEVDGNDDGRRRGGEDEGSEDTSVRLMEAQNAESGLWLRACGRMSVRPPMSSKNDRVASRTDTLYMWHSPQIDT